MLEQLFGSRTRWKLLKTFLTAPEKSYFIRELARLTDERINSVRRELSNLERWGLVSGLRIATAAKSAKQKKVVRQGKKFYQTNQAFPLLRELRDLVLKSWLLLERNLAKRLDKIGRIRLLILSGRFVGQTAQESQIPTTDIFIVGSVNRDKLKSLVSSISRSFGEDIRYTVMSTKEYKFRKDITDKFIYAILEGRHIKVIDRFSRGKQPSE